MSQDASFSEGADSALYLGAFTPEDVEVISTILQDGIFCINDLAWLKKKRQVAVLVNRFRWENKSEYIEKNSAPERVKSLLIIDNVLNISSQGIDRSDSTAPLNLLNLDLKKTKKNIKFEKEIRISDLVTDRTNFILDNKGYGITVKWEMYIPNNSGSKYYNSSFNKLKNIFRYVYGILFLLISIILSLSLFSFNINDSSFLTNSSGQITNIIGLPGSYVSSFLLYTFGIMAYFLVLFFIESFSK